MDDLLQLAMRLAEQDDSSLAFPISGRVAYVVSHGQSYASNGYAIRTQGIAQALNAQGCEVLCMIRPGRPWELNTQVDIMPEVTIDGVRYLHSRWPAGKVPKGEHAHLEASVERFIELFRVYRPEKVIAASNYIVGLPAWVAAKRLGLPFYNEVRGFWELSREAREPGYEKTPAFQQEAQRDTFIARKADRVFTLNQPMRSELARREIDPAKISIVPNGISQLPVIKSADDALSQKLGIDKGSKVIGYIGSLTAYEGLDVLTEACTDLIKAGEKIHLLFVGDDQPLDRAKDSIKSVADKPWLIQTGRVPHQQISDYYALLDVVVIPRKHSAVCQLVPPMKAVEALVYGKRLVASDVAPLAEYAQKHESVILFEADNAESLVVALQGSLKLPAPKPSSELLFSAHIEPMVRALKGEGSAPVSVTQSQGRESQQSGDVKALLTHTEPMTLQPIDPTWFTCEVIEGQQLTISAEVEYRNIAEGQKRKAVLLLQGLDASGNRVDRPLGKLAKSGHLNSHFMYLVATGGEVRQQHKFTVPAGITQVTLGLCAFNHQQGEEVVVRHLGVQDLGVRKMEPAQAEAVEQELTKTPCWNRFAVNELVPHSVTARLDFEDDESRHAKSAIVRVVYYDKDQQEIPPP
ncbi:glycosyltransferase, partial [Cobetia marina]